MTGTLKLILAEPIQSMTRKLAHQNLKGIYMMYTWWHVYSFTLPTLRASTQGHSKARCENPGEVPFPQDNESRALAFSLSVIFSFHWLGEYQPFCHDHGLGWKLVIVAVWHTRLVDSSPELPALSRINCFEHWAVVGVLRVL